MTKRDLLIDFLGWYQRNTQEEGTCNEKWMDEATVDSYLNQPQLQQHGVMQAEGSDGAKGAAVGKEREAKGVSVGKKLCECYDPFPDDNNECRNCNGSLVRA